MQCHGEPDAGREGRDISGILLRSRPPEQCLNECLARKPVRYAWREHIKKTRLQEWSKPPGALKFRIAVSFLEHAEYDRADKGECDIRGNHAQPVDQSHADLPGFSFLRLLPAVTPKASNPFPAEKVSPAALSRFWSAPRRRPRG
jgi:hypothetical protein